MGITQRKRINITVYPAVEELIIKKFGKLLNAQEALNYIVTNDIQKEKKNTSSNEELALLELKRIGNNLNQIAHYVNATKGIIPTVDLQNVIDNLNVYINKIKNEL